MSNPNCKAGCGFLCKCDEIPLPDVSQYIPAGYGCLEPDGSIEYTAPCASMCQEHINDGINEHGLDDMAKLKVVPIYYKIDS